MSVDKEVAEAFLAHNGHLPYAFLPPCLTESPENKPWESNAEWLQELLRSHFPTNRIPSKLMLRPGLSFQPPRFIFGWAMESDVMCRVARRCGIAPPWPSGTTEEVKQKCDGVIWSKWTPRLHRVLEKEFPELMALLRYPLIIPVKVEDGTRHAYCLGLADSYSSGNRLPSADHIETLQRFFGIGEGEDVALADSKPMWWVEFYNNGWRFENAREFSAKWRPWLTKEGIKKNDKPRYTII